MTWRGTDWRTDDVPELAAAPAPVPRQANSLARTVESLAGKLNEAARDLVEAIEGPLPRDLEKRFAAGEINVYTRRLYQDRKGGGFTKTLAKRYGADRALRASADDYIKLFERLLDTLSADGGSERMIETSLASEQGQVYVAIAESIGRIKPRG